MWVRWSLHLPSLTVTNSDYPACAAVAFLCFVVFGASSSLRGLSKLVDSRLL